MTSEEPRPEQEGFGEASLGEAQSENPPADPEMLDYSDQDAEAPGTAEQVEQDSERDQAEGDL